MGGPLRRASENTAEFKHEKSDCNSKQVFQETTVPSVRATRVALIDLAGDGDAGLAEDVGDLGLTEARGVVFESEMVVLFVDAEAAEAVGVGEFAQAAELFEAERGLQFEGDVEECHRRAL